MRMAGVKCCFATPAILLLYKAYFWILWGGRRRKCPSRDLNAGSTPTHCYYFIKLKRKEKDCAGNRPEWNPV